jgi:hypothetical protein
VRIRERSGGKPLSDLPYRLASGALPYAATYTRKLCSHNTACDALTRTFALLAGSLFPQAGICRQTVGPLERALLGGATADSGLEASPRRSGYREIDPGVFRSADDQRQFRITNSDLTDPRQGSHGHFESVGPDGRTIEENSHVAITS